LRRRSVSREGGEFRRPRGRGGTATPAVVPAGINRFLLSPLSSLPDQRRKGVGEEHRTRRNLRLFPFIRRPGPPLEAWGLRYGLWPTGRPAGGPSRVTGRVCLCLKAMANGGGGRHRLRLRRQHFVLTVLCLHALSGLSCFRVRTGGKAVRRPSVPCVCRGSGPWRPRSRHPSGCRPRGFPTSGRAAILRR